MTSNDETPKPQEGGPPPVEEAPKPKRTRKKKEASGDIEVLQDAPPWMNFKEVTQEDPSAAAVKAMAKKREEEALALTKGYSRYLCLRDCRNGKYRRGSIYPLPDGQPEKLFKRLD